MSGYIRSRRLLSASAAGAVAIVLVLLTENSLVPVAVDPDPVRLRLALLSPVVIVIAAVPTLVRPFEEVEAIYSRRLRQLRVCHLLWFGALVVLLGLATTVTWDDHELGRQVVRNVAFLLGLLLVAAGAMRDLAWVPPLLLVAITYARGMSYELGRPRPWALLLQPVDGPTVACSAGLLVLGALIFVSQRARPTSGRRT